MHLYVGPGSLKTDICERGYELWPISYLLYNMISSRIPVKKLRTRQQGIRRANYETPFQLQKLALTSPATGGRSVGIVC
jgi:hypothetical protein